MFLLRETVHAVTPHETMQGEAMTQYLVASINRGQPFMYMGWHETIVEAKSQAYALAREMPIVPIGVFDMTQRNAPTRLYRYWSNEVTVYPAASKLEFDNHD